MSEKTIHDILAQFREEALNNRHLGDCFERLIARYLQLDPLFADRFSNVWMWNEWPMKGNTGDIGIDLVGEERATGEFCAIQCKFYLSENTISQGDIDSFFAALGNAKFSSGLIVSTTDKWGSNAEKRLANPSKPVNRLRIQDLDDSPIDWTNFSLKSPDKLSLKTRRTPRPHTRKAIDDVKEGLGIADRGKLIMACGTGKTYTSLCIAEEMCPGGHILFLVPSLSLLTQALREWTAHATAPIHALAVCSDVNIGQRKEKGDDDAADYQLSDLYFPATTSAKSLSHQYRAIRKNAEKKNAEKPTSKSLTVVFSTYHSIASVAEAQKAGLPEFDLIICDEAHRTTGVTLMGQDESHFVKVHDAAFIKAKKRLYMTATPRLYGDDAKSKAAEASAELCSMDDVAYFGEELHRLGFGEAVGKNLLSDYKVLVLAVDEKYVNKAFQAQITNSDNELTLDDAVKITGCWNGLAKRLDNSTATATDFQGDTAHMTRAVAFSRSIKESKAFVQKMADLIDAYKADHPHEENILHCELDHVDGTFNAIQRNRLLDWLKEPAEPNRCRILSNARCLSEGVDVPMLDAVLFLNPRNSIVDVVQSVGRVMRKPPIGSKEKKTYGYIILPIGIPAGISPEEALKDNQKYKVVWQVLQALRAHDDRFNATINQIELNKKAPENLQIIGIGGESPGDDGKSDGDGKDTPGKVKETQAAFHFPELEAWKDALYAKIVLKCGSRRYWEDWAKDVAKIAQRHTDRIRLLLEQGDPKHTSAFATFLAGLHQNINPSITQEDGIEMLSQHLITRPVFDALFENYAFSEANPISRAMQSMLDALQDQALEKETASLDKFYASVRDRVDGIDNAEGKQKVITELYDKFFKEAFPKMSERLGIVYTPIPIVDFLLLSVEDVLNQEFKTSLAAENVHLIDPFTGTGTFIVRLLRLAVERGIIKPKDLLRKYQHELHANEIVLLAYYIAAINIEETFHTLQREASEKTTYAKGGNSSPLTDHSTLTTSPYVPFDGIVLTDTFQLSESRNEMEEKMFPENNKRVSRQRKSPIRVVAGNPPYSVNDNPVPYPTLDARITATYAEKSTATLKNSLYDSYVRAIRWASDRIAEQGIVAFVTNGSFIDGNAMAGLRASLAEEFTTIYIFNLRGNARTSGEQRRMEKDNVFGMGTRTPVAVSILVRNPDKTSSCEIYYHDIGNYLNREEKLNIVSEFGSINGIHRKNAWQRLQPNAQNDWINHRDPAFDHFTPLGNREDTKSAVFTYFTNGIKTGRDAWATSFSKITLENSMRKHIDNFNADSATYQQSVSKLTNKPSFDEVIKEDPKRLHWNRAAIQDAESGKSYVYAEDQIRYVEYRPFCKLSVYTDPRLNDLWSARKRFLPNRTSTNKIITVTGLGVSKDFSLLISDVLPDVQTFANGQSFPLYLYEKDEPRDGELSLDKAEGEVIDGYRRRHAITDGILAEFRKAYGTEVSKDDIFYYVYGILHSPEYRSRFSSDLKKMLPRIPLTKETADYQAFAQAGRDLAHWHLNYETIEPYPLIEVSPELGLDPWKQFHVTKMTFAKPTAEQKAAGLKANKTRIIYNAHLTLDGIPLEAYDYIVNGKPALEWIIERYQITIDNGKGGSGIKNDPNDWCREHNNPRYIVDLIKRVTQVSLESMKIVNNLPALNER